MDTLRGSATDRWYKVREIWTGLSGGLYYADDIDSSRDRDDAIRRAREFLRDSDVAAREMVAEEYDRVDVVVWEMDGDDEVRLVWHRYRNFDID